MLSSLFSDPLGVVIRVLAIFISITIHEMSHGYAAYFLGDNTAKEQGRLSINPIHHIDPVGLICMFVAGIGWAKPVPVNPYRMRIKNKKAGMAIVSLAGPLSNMVTSFICMLLAYTVMAFSNGSLATAFIDIAMQIAIMGLGLGVFNLIPIPPLDGSKILMAFLPNRIVDWVYRNEGFIRFGFMILIFFGAFSNIISTGIMFLFSKMSSWIISFLSLIGVF